MILINTPVIPFGVNGIHLLFWSNTRQNVMHFTVFIGIPSRKNSLGSRNLYLASGRFRKTRTHTRHPMSWRLLAELIMKIGDKKLTQARHTISLTGLRTRVSGVAVAMVRRSSVQSSTSGACSGEAIPNFDHLV